MLERLPPAFKIGAQPILMQDWLPEGPYRRAQIAAKRPLIAHHWEAIWRDDGASYAAQLEALESIIAHLGGAETPDNADLPPLMRAALMLEDDLVLMRKTQEGWALSVGAVCFPSSWRLAEKFGRPLAHIHAEVPHFGPKSRNNTIIERMFDALQPSEPLMRGNWSISPNGALHHPEPHRIKSGFSDWPSLTLRHERQTLLKLAQSQAILFTIRITPYHLAEIKAKPALAQDLAAQLAAMGQDEAQYKALTAQRSALIDWLGKTP